MIISNDSNNPFLNTEKLKIGMISDLHIKTNKTNDFFPFYFKVLDEFYAECEKRQVDIVMLLGDIYHVKDKVDTRVFHSVFKYFESKMAKIPHVVVVGNHDTVTGSTGEKIHFLVYFNKHAMVVDQYAYFDIKKIRLHFLSYLPDNLVKDTIGEIEFKNIRKVRDKKHILFTHLALQNFMFDNGHEDIFSDLTTEDLIDYGFNRIYSGHYHGHQDNGDAVYVSSPYSTHFNEYGDHGFVFLDIDGSSYSHEFVRCKSAPSFVKIELLENNIDEVLKIKNSFVRVIVDRSKFSGLEFEKIKEELTSNNFDVDFISKVEEEESIFTVSKWDMVEFSNIDVVIKKYLESSSGMPCTVEEALEFIGVKLV